VATHPSRDALAAAAAGDLQARRELAPHLRACARCREELARLLGLLEAAAEELIHSRPGCPSPETLAGLPPGAEDTDPHLRSCPLCREELRLIRRLETARALETALTAGIPHRPELTVEGELPLAAAVPGAGATLEIREGASLEIVVAGVKVRLGVHGGELVVEVPTALRRPLELLVENDLLERRTPLRPGRTVLSAAGWKTATVRPAGGTVP